MCRTFTLIAVLMLTACSTTASERSPLITVDKDPRPAFRVDPAKPYRLEVGRGSALQGMDTLTLTQDGQVVMHRRRAASGDNGGGMWERATLRLPAKVLADVLASLDGNEIMRLHKAYHADAADGTQWVIFVQQGEHEKSVYCNNYVPEPVRQFVADLDAILAPHTPADMRWKPIDRDADPHHDTRLWKSVR